MSSHLQFLRNLQRIFDEGVFVATYKHALLQSLADLAIERQPDADGGMRVPVSAISEKFIQYYWPQTAPYRGTDGVLRQNTGRQAAIINQVADARREHQGSLAALQRSDRRWRSLRNSVAGVIRQMPLWKLQTVAGEQREFMYRQSEYEKGSIRLLPDAVRSFRDLYVIVTNFVRGAWVGQIQSIGYNRDILGDVAGLPEFLFGTGRGSIGKYKDILQEYQQSRCFYCDKKTSKGELDHFIPWSRYPIDLGHNFVYAHGTCNNKKRDFLAGPDHLHKWRDQNLDEYRLLTDAFIEAGLSHDKDRSRHVAIWAYEQGEASGAHVWLEDESFEILGGEWREVLAVR